MYSRTDSSNFGPLLVDTAKRAKDKIIGATSAIFVRKFYIVSNRSFYQVSTCTIPVELGGVGSIIDNESALIFPIGDFRMLAFQIDRIFQSDELASELSQRSKLIADDRHDVEKITESYINIYKDIINKNQS